MVNFTENLEKTEDLINKIPKNKEIFNNVKIIAVTKTFQENVILDALHSGFYCFGENKVEECKNKFFKLRQHFPNIELHMIGKLQTNKIKDALKLFNFIHTLDREKLCSKISKSVSSESVVTKYFFIQVNIGNEPQKSGVTIPQSDEFIKWCINDLKLNVIGLMCIPPINENPNEFFLSLKEIALRNSLSKLSMGMSSDYLDAIRCGATHIRLGEALFGSRKKL